MPRERSKSAQNAEEEMERSGEEIIRRSYMESLSIIVRSRGLINLVGREPRQEHRKAS